MAEFIPPPPSSGEPTGTHRFDLADEVHALNGAVVEMKTAHRLGAWLVGLTLGFVVMLGVWIVATTFRNEAGIERLEERLDGQEALTQSVTSLHADVRVMTREIQHVRTGQGTQEEEIRSIRARIDEFANRRSR